MSAKRRTRRHTYARTALQRRAQKGFRGHPIATVAYYGPDDKFASKVAVGIILQEDGDVDFLERWFSEEIDARLSPTINQEIVDFIKRHGVRSVIVTDGIIGCPHEEGIDYPKGEDCPHCPYWAGRDRWTGELIATENGQPQPQSPVAGVAWYRPDQWDLLREVAEDAAGLEATYEEWVKNAEESLRMMQEVGLPYEKVDVDVEELCRWCDEHDLPVKSSTRARYAAHMMAERSQQDDK